MPVHCADETKKNKTNNDYLNALLRYTRLHISIVFQNSAFYSLARRIEPILFCVSERLCVISSRARERERDTRKILIQTLHHLTRHHLR